MSEQKAGASLHTERTGKEALHSRYNPAAEAEKYVSSLPLREGTLFFILIEPGMGYMIPALEERFPGAKIIPLHVEDENPQTILGNAIPDTEASNIEIIEWKPSLFRYKERYVHLLSESAAFIKRIDANKRTVAYFGKRWIRNFFKNIERTSAFLVPAVQNAPCIVAGAGPGLEAALPIIKRLKNERRAVVLAASSAVSPLLCAGVLPDMVVAADGGNWALFHLFSTMRLASPQVHIAASAFATLPPLLPDEPPLLLISDGSLWQKTVLTALALPFVASPQRGTVTAQAIDLAFALFRGHVFIAGLDLANDDIRAHARPYPLDFYIDADHRLAPAYSHAFARVQSGGASMNIYAEWFKRQLTLYRPEDRARLHTIGKNHPVFDRLPAWEQVLKTDSSFKEPLFKTIPFKKEKNASAILSTAIRSDETVRTELRSLLSLPADTGADDIVEVIQSCTPSK